MELSRRNVERDLPLLHWAGHALRPALAIRSTLKICLTLSVPFKDFSQFFPEMEFNVVWPLVKKEDNYLIFFG